MRHKIIWVKPRKEKNISIGRGRVAEKLADKYEVKVKSGIDLNAMKSLLSGKYDCLVTHKGFPEEIAEVRNTFGSNLSFKADVLSEMGVKGKGLLQGEETELCERMRKRFEKGVIYNPNAIVYHKIFPERLRMRFLLRRAFWQGCLKRVMKELGYSISEEEKFVKSLFTNFALYKATCWLE